MRSELDSGLSSPGGNPEPYDDSNWSPVIFQFLEEVKNVLCFVGHSVFPVKSFVSQTPKTQYNQHPNLLNVDYFCLIWQL